MQVSHSLQVVGSQTGFPKGLKKKSLGREEGLTILEFRGHWGEEGGKSILEFPKAREG